MKTWILLLLIGPVCCLASGSVYSPPDSCQGRCNEKYNPRDMCHCNSKCEKHRNCCEDYHIRCRKEGFSSSEDAITNEDLQKVSEQLHKSDSNRAAESDITLNKQHLASNNNNQDDESSEPLFTYVNQEKLFSKPTYASFIKLLDNYHKKVGQGEKLTAEQLKEQDTFLEEIMKTEVMKGLYQFLHKKNHYGTEAEFVADLKEMWFGLYSRSNDEDSSGFEHVFIGEIKKGKVAGFHNWIHFYLMEKQGLVNYFSYSYDGPWTSYPDVLSLQFSWDGFYKKVGTAIIGSSPEFEFGLYSLCFIARPGKVCRLKIGGHDLGIQTYTWDKSTYGQGKRYIATAYVVSL
ncbi:uridylate-specific endoribonuclease isoform X2 [Hemicordylus capensis]|uniref:uridylate-specific endoribonuclease isoform X2 n=1 Tax=Hemicordylus capensis TaxID=884348 RepID=UPI0023027F4D|nr:uridylate-specific endoribonuclease isoform X2 [Hemicordylus capensis]